MNGDFLKIPNFSTDYLSAAKSLSPHPGPPVADGLQEGLAVALRLDPAHTGNLQKFLHVQGPEGRHVRQGGVGKDDIGGDTRLLGQPGAEGLQRREQAAVRLLRGGPGGGFCGGLPRLLRLRRPLPEEDPGPRKSTSPARAVSRRTGYSSPSARR